jgi:tRNA-dihydrouridine synthase 3
MVARGALIKPWLFREIRERRTWSPTADERIAVYHRLALCLKEHFRDDAKGRERAMRFLPWHLSFFCRYRPLSDATRVAGAAPLLQQRIPLSPDAGPLDLLLADPRAELHERLAAELWDSVDAADAVQRFVRVASDVPPCRDDPGEVAVAHG